MINALRAAALLLAACPALALAGEAAPAPEAGPVAPAQAHPTFQLNETQQYCQNIAAAAADARFAWQRKQLTDLEAQLRQRIADLNAREASFKEFLAHRDAVMKQASEEIVGIYAKMKAETAARQIAALDDDLAAAILAQLTQKQASAILNEVDTERAVKLINAMTVNPNAAGKKS